MRKKESYTSGDQIHFIVTEDFVKTVNDFTSYCQKNSINFSGAIRLAIANWLIDKHTQEKAFEMMKEEAPDMRMIAEAYEREVFRED